MDYSAWAATTDRRHQDCVRAILQRLWDDQDPATGASRWIYKAKRAGHYSIRQEQFLTEKEMGPDGTFGPEWGQVEYREEENYYFRLEGQREWLLGFIDERSRAGRPFVVPDFRVSELRNAVEKLAGDLCISRPKARLSWGIELPFDPDYVTYVWFDALVNYLSFAPGYDPAPGADLTEFRRWWPAWHVIGKDILIPAHGVYWPVMLHALGFRDERDAHPARAWLVDGRRREDEQEPRQRRRSERSRRPFRSRGVALFPDERVRDGPGRGLHRGAPGQRVQHGPGEHRGQPCSTGA